jgi:hypothetical protein
MCPGCGRSKPGLDSSRLFNYLLIGFLVLVGVVKCLSDRNKRDRAARARVEGMTAAAPKPAPPPEKAIPVKAEKLHRDYDANEAAADDKYKGKLLLVEGVIKSINKDRLDNVVLILNSGNRFSGVHATLTEAAAWKASELKKRQRVEVQCRGGSRISGSATLDDCALTATWR